MRILYACSQIFLTLGLSQYPHLQSWPIESMCASEWYLMLIHHVQKLTSETYQCACVNHLYLRTLMNGIWFSCTHTLSFHVKNGFTPQRQSYFMGWFSNTVKRRCMMALIMQLHTPNQSSKAKFTQNFTTVLLLP